MQDKWHIEWFTKDGKRVGMDFSAYCSQDVINYAEQMPSYYQLADYPTKVESQEN